jgi:hypothetical protein
MGTKPANQNPVCVFLQTYWGKGTPAFGLGDCDVGRRFFGHRREASTWTTWGQEVNKRKREWKQREKEKEQGRQKRDGGTDRYPQRQRDRHQYHCGL